MAKTHDQKKRPGRPPGRRNTPRATVACIPARCPSCGRAIRVNLQTKPTHVLPITGQIRGQHFRQMEFRHVDCPCGQGLTVRSPVTDEPAETADAD